MFIKNGDLNPIHIMKDADIIDTADADVKVALKKVKANVKKVVDSSGKKSVDAVEGSKEKNK